MRGVGWTQRVAGGADCRQGPVSWERSHADDDTTFGAELRELARWASTHRLGKTGTGRTLCVRDAPRRSADADKSGRNAERVLAAEQAGCVQVCAALRSGATVRDASPSRMAKKRSKQSWTSCDARSHTWRGWSQHQAERRRSQHGGKGRTRRCPGQVTQCGSSGERPAWRRTQSAERRKPNAGPGKEGGFHFS